ncbi:MAG: RNA polymerase sigma-54 factor [Magnetovibrio sp.]|nr:RNA polymerase sigma-54 factor [Magnetovibrio sp.]
MVLSPRLEQRQTQALVMTPQLQQAIKLLQLSNVDLAAYIEHELQENPMLERDELVRDESTDDPIEIHAEGLVEDNAPDPASLEDINFEKPQEAGLDSTLGFDADYDSFYSGNENSHSELSDNNGWSELTSSDPSYPNSGGGFDTPVANFEEILEQTPSLRDHLLEQLAMEITDVEDRIIGLNLIDTLDEAGYLRTDVDGIADLLGCEINAVEKVIKRLQLFDPPGIFARDLRECLAIQLRDKNRLDPCITIFLDHLDLVAKRELESIAKICQCNLEDVKDMIAEIQALDPKPAVKFNTDIIQPITPDVLIHANPKGGWIIELNSASLPRVLINNEYYAKIQEYKHSKEDRQYITEQLQSANWLVKALHQRATTILKVATELVRQQEDFFLHGVQHLKPLILRDIADAVELHESTISRVTSNKFVATPRGIFELKYFFTPAISSVEGGSSHSAEAVRHRIKILVDNECPKTILSDDKLVTLLKADGIDIARRTVAKYREGMKIPSSVQRRRDKRAT